MLYPVKKHSGLTIGGKATGLLKLREAGLRVPDFLVVPAESFKETIQAAPVGSSAIHEQLLGFSLHATDRSRLQEVLSGWGFPAKPVIVRSSIADEDGAQDAFAGIMTSYSNLNREEDVVEAIAKCAASAYTPEAMAYRRQRNLMEQAQPAVIVQQQLLSEVSGVVFSTYPQHPEEMAIHAVWGLGEGLVNGTLDPDEFYLFKKDGSLSEQQIAFKSRKCIAGPDRGLLIAEVPPEQQNQSCLNSIHLEQLFTYATQLEKALEMPQDIEFVYLADQLYFVQSRPITQVIPQRVVYDNSNIQESYCGVTTPLTFSFAQRVYATVYLQTMALLSIPEKVVEVYRPVLNDLLGLVSGRIYYNINNWYRGLQLFPSFKQNKEDMEKMMGLEEPVDFITDRKKTFREKLDLMPVLLSNMARLLLAFRKLKKGVALFHQDFTAYYKAFYQRLNHIDQGTKVLDEKQKLDKALLENWTTPIVNDFYVMIMNGKVRRKLAKAGIHQHEEFLSRYFAGNQQIESTQPAVVMQKLALKAMEQEELKTLLVQLPDNVHQQVKNQFPLFFREVQTFIDTYGDRTVGELKLETVTMRLSPKIFYSYLRNYLTAERVFNTMAHSSLHEGAQQELDELLKGKSWTFRKSLLGSLKKLQEGIQYREGMRLERTRLFGMYRSLYLVAGKLLRDKGLLEDIHDIFYLTEQEIASLLVSSAGIDVSSLTKERKAIFDQYKQEDVPARVIVPAPRSKEKVPLNEDSGVLYGTGCVPGEVTAEIAIIKGPEDNLDVSGKIVCALRTDPGWVALFPTCKGVLIEKGSALSHSVIILREFGIPAIINIPGLTTKLQSGQQIRMNGTTGEIVIQ